VRDLRLAYMKKFNQLLGVEEKDTPVSSDEMPTYVVDMDTNTISETPLEALVNVNPGRVVLGIDKVSGAIHHFADQAILEPAMAGMPGNYKNMPLLFMYSNPEDEARIEAVVRRKIEGN
jgi:hypothetical protein